MNSILVAKHVQNFALGLLARSVHDTTFSEMQRPFAHDMAVAQVAQALEILIKGKLIEADPICIFEKNQDLSMFDWSNEELLLNLKTKKYTDLPAMINEKFGLIIDSEQYEMIGFKRNRAIHLGNLTNEDASRYVLKTTFEFILPLAIKLNIKIIDFIQLLEEWDESIIADGYLKDQLERFDVLIPEKFQNLLNSYDQ